MAESTSAQSLDNFSIVGSRCLTRQQFWCATAANTTLFHLCCVICTGCASQNVLRSVWPFLCSCAATAQHQNIWREIYSYSWQSNDGSAYDLRRVTNWSSGAPLSRLKTISDRVFSVAASRVWNGLPLDVTAAQSLLIFKKHLKPHLF